MPERVRSLSQVRILSFDGGGVRGVMPAYWLMKLEESLQSAHNQTALQTFDWFAGTSTGAIIAAGIACGLRPDRILALYREEAATIFPGFLSKRIWNPARWSGFLFPKHSDKGLNTVLRNSFKRNSDDLTMADIDPTKRLLVVAYEGGSRTPVVFDSKDPRFADLPVWQACRASAAAPTYLPEAEFTIDGIDCSFLDGGVVANDPAAIAVAKVRELSHDREAVLVVSLGTGQSGAGFNPKRRWKFSGAGPWLSSLPTTLMEGSGGGYSAILRDVLDDRHYYRFDSPIRLAKSALDNSSKKQLSALLTDATSYWKQRDTTEQCNRLLANIEAGCQMDLSSFEGEWKSEYTWADKQGSPGKLTERVAISVLTGQFLRGKTISESKYPGSFELSRVGTKGNFVGVWYNEKRTRSSSFVLTPSDNDSKLEGPWIGCGDDDSPGGHYEGTWTLTKIPQQ